MSAHRAIIEAGPGTIRRLCCGTTEVVDDIDMAEIAAEALSAIDDRVVLVGGRPVTVHSLWCAALKSVFGNGRNEHKAMMLVHPSWWPAARIGVVTAAARTLTDDVALRPRSWLLAQASDADPESTVVVEIAERLVAITGAEAVAMPLGAQRHAVAQQVVAVLTDMAPPVVLIDGPSSVAGAPPLAASIACSARAAGRVVMEIGDARLRGLARSASAIVEPSEPRCGAGAGRIHSPARVVTGLAGAAVVVPGLFLAVAAVPPGDRHGGQPPAPVRSVPTTFLVEGRVALTVPADWPAQRVVAGPGSARVQVTSPLDSEVALHVTQSPVAGETLSGTAERLKHAIDAEPAGVFVDFNPSGIGMGRPAVTYREVRANHHVRWTVLLDGPVRISIGCQSRPGDDEAVRDACEQAVRSAHAIG